MNLKRIKMLLKNDYIIKMANWIDLYKEVEGSHKFTKEEKEEAWKQAIEKVPKTRSFMETTLKNYGDFFPKELISPSMLKYMRVMYAKKILILKHLKK